MSTFVFIGPSIPRDEAARLLNATFLPPVAQGDVIRLCRRETPAAIGIVDGYFECVPAVWHKEILFALERGVAVYGAASMGALRAAELHPFGMIGVGAIFEAFRDGRLEDDDEVAVTHGPAELGYPILSEAMVNIRRTLADAAAAAVLPPGTARALEDIAKDLPYPRRSYGHLLRLAGDLHLDAAELARFRAWLPAGRFDQKRDDARAMLRMMRHANQPAQRPPARFHFERTVLWERAVVEALAA
ncbi:TfuA-like protein [Azospirillum halopraeferens]|uniref:TfuA-like protein n=1 Tax=Azospirillum halopraeferens TaxID=34010 RepID=UPI00042364AB|nr:TfuA-like protein [Azospirillum halopraeferens]